MKGRRKRGETKGKGGDVRQSLPQPLKGTYEPEKGKDPLGGKRLEQPDGGDSSQN